MTPEIAALLAQDGFTTGAIYALLAIALVLVFAVTRVIFVPQGEFVAFGTLSLAALEAGQTPKLVWLLIALALLASLAEVRDALRRHAPATLAKRLALWLALPLAIAALVAMLAPLPLPAIARVALVLLLVAPIGGLVYRSAFQPVAHASVLVLLIVAVAVHFTLTGLALLLFGAEGSRTTPFSSAQLRLGSVSLSAQSLWIYATTLALIGALYWLFGSTLVGKALRATGFNRVGARLVGISPNFAGALSFLLAALLGALSGVLIGPVTTVYYDSGFLIGLKGFVGAIIGGLVSYPAAAIGALLVGLLESFSSFWASAYKEVIVFTLIIPVLLWRSIRTHHHEEEE